MFAVTSQLMCGLELGRILEARTGAEGFVVPTQPQARASEWASLTKIRVIQFIPEFLAALTYSGAASTSDCFGLYVIEQSGIGRLCKEILISSTLGKNCSNAPSPRIL